VRVDSPVKFNKQDHAAVLLSDEARRVSHAAADVRMEPGAAESAYPFPVGGMEERPERPALLLHSCCGPCSTAVVERLSRRFRLTLYFCNSNIMGEEEYRRRLEAQRAFVEAYNASADCAAPLSLVTAPYAPEAFLETVRGLEAEPEGGARCRVCIADRLEHTAVYASLYGFDAFSTTLSVSPHKDFGAIARIGRELALRYGIAFLAEDFKKRDGFRRSVVLSEAYGLYRQSYCGCRFSVR